MFKSPRIFLSFRGVALALAVLALAIGPLSATQAAASEATILPFFSKPYPSGYTRPIRDPEVDCWIYRRVETLFGSRVDRIWICGNPLVERY